MKNSLEALLPSNEIKGLIFDLDGTLADTMHLHLKSWKETGSQWGVAITDKMINDRAGTPTIQVLEQLNKQEGWSIDPYEFRARKNKMYQLLKKEQGKIKPILPVLNIVKSFTAVLPQSVGTGSIRTNALMALKDLNLENHFTIVVTADDVEKHKPHPETFLKCAEAMKISPSECLVYEDGMMGIQAALSAGMQAVHIVEHKIYKH